MSKMHEKRPHRPSLTFVICVQGRRRLQQLGAQAGARLEPPLAQVETLPGSSLLCHRALLRLQGVGCVSSLTAAWHFASSSSGVHVLAPKAFAVVLNESLLEKVWKKRKNQVLQKIERVLMRRQVKVRHRARYFGLVTLAVVLQTT